MLALIGAILRFAIGLYILVMWARLILDYARFFAPRWKPKGFVLVLCELVYTLTDPPINMVRKVVPPLRVGNIAIDLAWMIVVFALLILQFFAGFIR